MSAAGEAKPSQGPQGPTPREFREADARTLRVARQSQ
jgi:hypothetical protein